ncbi:MAG: hypothetical protein RQ826_09540 [Xanthomonadales bacterium]|nr:hypothetical protein [Xanthomonadales bacterium]
MSRDPRIVRSMFPQAVVSLDPKCDQIWKLMGLDQKEPEDTDDLDDYEEPCYGRAEQFEKLVSKVPKDHVRVSTMGMEIPHSPGLTWDIEMTWFLAPAENPEMEWLLYCINWDDNWEVYEVLFVAECKGFSSPAISTAAMLEATFENWNMHMDPEYPGWELVDQIVQSAK